MHADSIEIDPTAGFVAMDTWSIVALGVGALMAGLWAMSRGYGRDPLGALVKWCQVRGLEFVERPDEPDVVGTFAGSANGADVRIEVRRLPHRKLTDLPPQLTTVSAAASYDGAPVLIQPVEWVMDVEGNAVEGRLPTGDTSCDERWAVYGADPFAAKRVLTAAVRRRLMEPDTELLSILVADGAVVTRHPGIVHESRELERRVAVVTDVAAALAGPVT